MGDQKNLLLVKVYFTVATYKKREVINSNRILSMILFLLASTACAQPANLIEQFMGDANRKL
jgi:hypothetical protein